MARFLDNIGLAYFWEKIKAWIPFLSRKTQSIPFGQVDSTSTSTVFTATIDGITELRDGVCCYLKNGVVTSASGWTLDINGLGAKPVYGTMAAATRSTNVFNINYTMLFVYNSTRVEGGCWDIFYGFNSNDEVNAYNIRQYYHGKKTKTILYRYKFLLTCMDGLLLPVNTVSTTATTKQLTTESFDVFGEVYYYGTTTSIQPNTSIGVGYLWSQATYPLCDLRYSFNTGTTLVAGNDLYLVCSPQNDGSVKLAKDPIAFTLPNTEDGLLYKRLGKCYDTYRIILEQHKPVYYYKDGAIRIWANQAEQDVPEYTIEKLTTAETGYSSSYILKKDNVQVGATINIPKDMVVSDGEVNTVTTANVPYQGAQVGDKYIDLTIANASSNHIYIPVKDLVTGFAIDNEVVHKAGAETITGEKTFEANVNLTEGATLNLIYDSQTPDGVYLQATEPNGIKAVSFNGISDDGMVQIKNVYVPTNDTDAANKYYVDEEILDIDEYRVYLACRFGPYGVHQKSLCAFCLTNGGREMMMTSFTETSGTGAKEVITDLEFPIGCKIYYNDIMYDLLPNTSGMANRYYTSFNGVDVRYSAVTGTSISLGNYPSETQSTVYLHVIVEDGYWRPYYKEGATNEIIVDSFHMQSGNFYIYLGKTVRNTGYMIQLEDNNPLYYYDGTQLVDYATWIASQNAPQFTYEYKKFDMQYQEIRSGGLIVYDWASSTLASLSNGTYKVTVQRHAYSSVTWPSVLHMTLRYGGDNSWVGISASTSIIPAAIQTQDAYDPLGAITVVMVGFLTLGDQRNNLQLVQEGVSGLCFGGELPYGGSCIESVVVNDFVLLEKIG